MLQPDSLKSNEYQAWSRGRGVDVWAMPCASITGDLETISKLVDRDGRVVECEYECFTPIHFAVRENQREVVGYLLDVAPSQTTRRATCWCRSRASVDTPS